MKTRILLLLVGLLSISVSAQKKKKAKHTDFSITQTKAVKKSGTQLVLKEVISDARCPENTTCVWAGEAQANVSVYKNGKWNDEVIVAFSPQKEHENKEWLSKMLAIPAEKIKSITLVPYPKEGGKINPKSYKIEVKFNP